MDPSLAVARSRCPSPLKSLVVIDWGYAPLKGTVLAVKLSGAGAACAAAGDSATTTTTVASVA